MSGIIKSRDVAKSPKVRSFSAVARLQAVAALPAEPEVDPRLVAAEAALAQVQAALAAKDAEIEDLVTALESAFTDGRTEGREAALKEAAAQREALVAKLQTTGERAVAVLERDLGSLERLAVTLTLEALGKVLGEPGAFASLAPQIIREQLARVDAHSVLRIQVSPSDFPDADELATLATAIGHPGLEILPDGRLASGDCAIKLVLGTLEVGTNQQWSRLKDALEPLALPGGAA